MYEDTGNFHHTDDQLWDGKRYDSEGQCCSNATTWFNVDLPDDRANERIEIRFVEAKILPMMTFQWACWIYNIMCVQ